MGVAEVGCLAHARCKFFDPWANHKSRVAEATLKSFGELYDVEREVQDVTPDERRRMRQLKARPVADVLNKGLTAGKRAAGVMRLVHSAWLNGHDPHVYLKDVLERLPPQPASRIRALLPHRWTLCPSN